MGNPLAEARRGRRAARALGIAILVLAARAGAQPSGIISGVVLDATTQAPLAGALITARSPALMGEQIAVTDDAGAFEMTLRGQRISHAHTSTSG